MTEFKKFIFPSTVCLTQIENPELLHIYIHYLGRTCEEQLGQYAIYVRSNFNSEVYQFKANQTATEMKSAV